MKKTDYSGLISKKPWNPIPMTPDEAKESAYANEQNKKWLPLPKPGLLERLIDRYAYRSIRDFVRSVPYWKWRPCNRGCFLTCKGHVDAGVSNTGSRRRYPVGCAVGLANLVRKVNAMKRLWKRIKLTLGIGRKHFVWFDLERHICYKIDGAVTGPDGQPCPPVDCVRVALGEKVKIYRSKAENTLHACIRGRAVEWDKRYGLFCGSDFDADNYDFIGTFLVSRGTRQC